MRMISKKFCKVEFEKDRCCVDGVEIISLLNAGVSFSSEMIPQVTLTFLTDSVKMKEVDAEVCLTGELEREIILAKKLTELS